MWTVNQWAKAIPVALSDTVNNIGGLNGSGQNNLVAKALHNRGAAAILAHIVFEGDGVQVLRILPGDAEKVVGGSQWKRVNLTGTTTASGAAYETILVTTVGSAFGNQPSNDGVEVLSASAADTTQTVTIYGTTTGTDTLVSETVTLNGTTFVATTKVDWGIIVGVELSASCAGTVTIREASGDAVITTILTTVLNAGVQAVTITNPHGGHVAIAASGATTKQVGLYGTSPAGAVQGDSQALNGTNVVLSNLVFGSVTKVFTGDVENTVTLTVSSGADLVALY